ncbi:hypothetical protein [Gordonia sp. (in: high G+C Gram-positive bacteria)]|uniref:hypothetical protein n=1 Tax=Gordonia sp. (in: high G+C Gram-positive bacteria) TaxID=84139 RepID=UPI0039E4FC54
MTHLIRILFLLSLFTGGAPAVAAPAPPASAPPAPVHQGDRIAITFVSDVRDNGPTSWFDSLDRPRTQDRTVLVQPVTGAGLWTSTLVYTSRAPRQRLTATLVSRGGFARCVVTVNDAVRDVRTVVRRGARVTCAP